ncbi:MAG: ATP-binding protein, partial [Cloacibacillus sp.]
MISLGIETETLEFKKSTGEMKEAVDSICAILNKHGAGELYFGVRSDGIPIGQTITEKTLRDISAAIENHITPQIFPEITVTYLNERACILIKFEGANIPYFAYGKAKIR